MAALNVRLPDSLHRAAREEAARDGVSVNQLITVALAEKLAALKTLDLLRQRAELADEADWETIFAEIPHVEPEPHDRLPEGYKRKKRA